MTKASWKKLQELTNEFEFILIGGWAIFIWTKKHKSKDIDIVVDYEILSEIQERYPLTKNNRLKKYEVKFDEFDIDIYLPYYSKLAIPIEDLKELSVKVQGIRTVALEALLILKQAAEIERRNSVKGQKDSIDILTILIHGGIDLNKYNEMLVKYDLGNYVNELIFVIQSFDKKNLRYIDLNLKKFADWKKGYIKKLRKLK
ncbi:MAG: hypothetical protein JSW00_02265 [Thermoplasmata archaeon]|nr:MAG: hypothetical protein JSW00_02265 [Thermoplasmata archaeon]